MLTCRRVRPRPNPRAVNERHVTVHTPLLHSRGSALASMPSSPLALHWPRLGRPPSTRPQRVRPPLRAFSSSRPSCGSRRPPTHHPVPPYAMVAAAATLPRPSPRISSAHGFWLQTSPRVAEAPTLPLGAELCQARRPGRPAAHASIRPRFAPASGPRFASGSIRPRFASEPP